MHFRLLKKNKGILKSKFTGLVLGGRLRPVDHDVAMRQSRLQRMIKMWNSGQSTGIQYLK